VTVSYLAEGATGPSPLGTGDGGRRPTPYPPCPLGQMWETTNPNHPSSLSQPAKSSAIEPHAIGSSSPGIGGLSGMRSR